MVKIGKIYLFYTMKILLVYPGSLHLVLLLLLVVGYSLVGVISKSPVASSNETQYSVGTNE